MNMKRILPLLLSLAMALALCACGKDDSKDTAGDKKTFIMGVDPEYPPFSYLGDDGKFTGFDVEICQAVLDHLHATPENKVILNLPTTVENCMPNQFADMLEYFIRKLPSRDSAIISLHPHNDRGTGVATAEMGLLAGADRVEATLFGNGERTGNVDIVTLAMNMYTQGVDPELDFSNMNKIKEMFERTTKMPVGDRQPYAGKLVFTAFSGSHQDAINKGSQYMKESNSDFWEIPYLPIDPADVGRQYEPIIRINSQSGKGGAAFVMQHSFGFDLPKAMHPEFGHIVQVETDKVGTEICAALKNIIALCAGCTDGMGCGDNTKALLMTRGLAEMARLGVALGGKKETFTGLAGVGDLIVTCCSMHSRNRRCGILIGQGKPVQQALDEIGAVVEGYYAAANARTLAQKAGVEMPIAQAAYEVLYEGRDPKLVVIDLMGRAKRSELEESWS